MPFPSTTTIHPDWSPHHQPAAAGALNGPGIGGWTPTGGAQPSTPGALLHEGPFRAQPLDGRGGAADAARQDVTQRAYQISLEADAPEVPVDAAITITACPDDTTLVGKVLTVTGLDYSSRRFERVVYADLNLQSQPGGAP
jgi:hypothetical protein